MSVSIETATRYLDRIKTLKKDVDALEDKIQKEYEKNGKAQKDIDFLVGWHEETCMIGMGDECEVCAFIEDRELEKKNAKTN